MEPVPGTGPSMHYSLSGAREETAMHPSNTMFKPIWLGALIVYMR